jgi:hypothetical protein
LTQGLGSIAVTLPVNQATTVVMLKQNEYFQKEEVEYNIICEIVTLAFAVEHGAFRLKYETVIVIRTFKYLICFYSEIFYAFTVVVEGYRFAWSDPIAQSHSVGLLWMSDRPLTETST